MPSKGARLPQHNPLQLGLNKVPASFHRKIPSDFVEYEEEQTVAEFIDMGKREPNEEGTGRWLLTPSRNTIRFVTTHSLGPVFQERLSKLISVFFGSHLTCVWSPRSPSTLPVTKKQYTTAKVPGVQGNSVEIWSVLDKLIPCVTENDYCLVALTEWSLFEDCSEEEEEYVEVLGRACGDRVAVVQATTESLTQGFFGLVCTVLHEILHTCGFDHTTTRQCLMNPSPYLDDWLFLCPHNVWKLGIFLGVNKEDIEAFSRQHYAGLLANWTDIFETPGEESDEVIEAGRRWLEKRLLVLFTSADNKNENKKSSTISCTNMNSAKMKKQKVTENSHESIVDSNTTITAAVRSSAAEYAQPAQPPPEVLSTRTRCRKRKIATTTTEAIDLT